jgi:alpha-L-fucosidase
MSPKRYEETWNSLKRHQQPQWIDDAKFGIYFHWGVYSVPAFGNEWYPHKMYHIGDMYNYHAKTYGEPDEFGYKDFIPKFTAEHFNAEEWVKMFKDAGAKFAGPVAEHHDGFSMWDSKVNKWNAAKMGPKRDIVGEIAEAIKKQDMKFITTFHHSHNWYYYYHYEGLDNSDPEYAGLYGKPHPAANNEGTSAPSIDRPDKEFCEVWFAKIKEVVDNYEPDLIWFDFGLKWIPDKYKRKMAAYYYNKGLEWDREVEIIYKEHNMPPGMGLLDYERGSADKLTHYKWITDTFVGTKSWSYVKDEVFKPTEILIHNFIDRISKNGYILMNWGPKANGQIPDEVKDRLLSMGNWIRINQEAIYGSTPWVLAEEGPTESQKNSKSFNELIDSTYSSKDIRFVTKDYALYAFILGWPENEILIKSLTLPPKRKIPKEYYLIEDSDIKYISMLGSPEELKWKLTHNGLKIKKPNNKPCEYAYTIKIAWS